MMLHSRLGVVGFAALVVAVALGAFAQEVGPERFAGTWYAGLPTAPFKLVVDVRGDAPTASIVFSTSKTTAIEAEVHSVAIDGNTLRIEFTRPVLGASPTTLELRPPKDGLIGKLEASGSALAVVVSRETPELKKPFDNVEVVPLEKAWARARRASCQNNLKQLGLVMKMFTNQSKGEVFPALDPRPGYLTFRSKDIYPEYLTDPNILLCPADQGVVGEARESKPEPQWYFDNSSYWYLGFALPDEKTALAFVEAYRKEAATGKGFEREIEDAEGNTIYRLREGIWRLLITDISNPAEAARAQSEIPLMICRPGNHGDEIEVLFMDAHVQRLHYPGEFPASKRFVEGLLSLDRLRKR